ncbi:hypothetical protein LTR62_003579 [Meristemomyces frigidus]|uniref:Uncharacterized protein n=1 Tax=Meristemomyces frigidus TaxID=1508187 RepID=A0AAN7TJ21_9PEZI|nr:hypothetical protein LTR62_003579 [Meristemomyces frigidus]
MAGSECVYGDPPQSSSGSPTRTLGLTHDGTYDALDLLLMHRFATVTALELFPSSAAAHVWQNVLPVQAHTEPLLMHGILALSGMDLAQFDGEMRSTYRTRALHHQQIGLAMFQEILAHDSAAQIHSVFPFSLILIILAYASVHSENVDWTLDAMLDLFALYRGPRMLAISNWKAIADSEILALLRPGNAREADGPGAPVREALQQLQSYASDDVAREAVKLLSDAIEISANSFDMRVVGRWPSSLSDEFFTRLKQHQPEALMILSYYSIALAAFRDRWWIGSWDRKLVAAVASAVPIAEQKLHEWSADSLEIVLDWHAGASTRAS